MERPQKPDNWLALFTTLADAEAALHALQAAGAPYPAMQLGAHTAADLAQLSPEERDHLAGIDAPAQFWSIAITPRAAMARPGAGCAARTPAVCVWQPAGHGQPARRYRAGRDRLATLCLRKRARLPTWLATAPAPLARLVLLIVVCSPRARKPKVTRPRMQWVIGARPMLTSRRPLIRWGRKSRPLARGLKPSLQMNNS